MQAAHWPHELKLSTTVSRCSMLRVADLLDNAGAFMPSTAGSGPVRTLADRLVGGDPVATMRISTAGCPPVELPELDGVC